MSTTSNLCVLAVVPPEELWPRFQAFRDVDGKQAERWPPHITIAFPFVRPDFLSAAISTLQATLERFPAFDMDFQSASYLKTKKKKGASRTWHFLDPVAPSKAMLKKLIEVVYKSGLRIGEPRELTPHMSITQAPLKESTALSKSLNSALKASQSLRFRVDHVCVMARKHDSNGRVVCRIPLK